MYEASFGRDVARGHHDGARSGEGPSALTGSGRSALPEQRGAKPNVRVSWHRRADRVSRVRPDEMGQEPETAPRHPDARRESAADRSIPAADAEPDARQDGRG